MGPGHKPLLPLTGLAMITILYYKNDHQQNFQVSISFENHELPSVDEYDIPFYGFTHVTVVRRFLPPRGKINSPSPPC